MNHLMTHPSDNQLIQHIRNIIPLHIRIYPFVRNLAFRPYTLLKPHTIVTNKRAIYPHQPHVLVSLTPLFFPNWPQHVRYIFMFQRTASVPVNIFCCFSRPGLFLTSLQGAKTIRTASIPLQTERLREYPLLIQ